MPVTQIDITSESNLFPYWMERFIFLSADLQRVAQNQTLDMDVPTVTVPR